MRRMSPSSINKMQSNVRENSTRYYRHLNNTRVATTTFYDDVFGHNNNTIDTHTDGQIERGINVDTSTDNSYNSIFSTTFLNDKSTQYHNNSIATTTNGKNIDLVKTSPSTIPTTTYQSVKMVLSTNRPYHNLTTEPTSTTTNIRNLISSTEANASKLDAITMNNVFNSTTSPSNHTNSYHANNASENRSIDKNNDALNSTTNETLLESIQTLFLPSQTTTNYPDTLFFNNSDNGTSITTDDYHYSNFQSHWRENANVTINESIVQINDSIVFIPPYNNIGERSNLFINGMAKIDSSPETITKVFILAIVSIFGSIGNFLVVGSVIKNRNLHRPPFYFLLSMGITDLARAGFCLPVVMATALQGSIWRHGDTACKMFAFAASFFVFSSTLSLLVIAIERHLSIVHAKAYRRRCHGFVNLFATLFIWVTAFVISFPPIFGSLGAGEYVFISEEAQCAYNHKHFSHNDGLNSVLIFIGITSLTLFLYYRIFVFMRSHRRMRPLQHRPAFSSTWAFIGPGANGQAFINWLNGFGGNASNVYRRPAQAAATTVIGSENDDSRTSITPRFAWSGGDGFSGRPQDSRVTPRGRVVNLCTTRNEHLTRLFFIMTLVHGAAWLPYVILSMWRVFITSSDIPVGFIAYAAWLSYSQVAICPMTYFLSRGRSKSTSRVIHMDPSSNAQRQGFLLEDKIRHK